MSTSRGGARHRWSLLVPVKHLAGAKTRLARFAGAHRSDLALAIACDTVMAAVDCPAVASVFAVTDDPRAADALGGLGAHVVAGEPGTGLNPALVHGAAEALRRRPGRGLCALSADLPALRPAELDLVLGDAAAHERAFLADAPGVGTTLYTAAPGAAFTPAFEGASRRRHHDGGAAELVRADVPSVRRDVDTPEDLHGAVALGVGPHTAKLLGLLGLPDVP
ncbi:2-phospho-L-lactate guanylyltransferase [Nocardiopsis mwathae]|uniref:Phosphoenolpyruvate guanylyltransferase n=1 Tax=Nocardiopsis mwathae TaxID=1472723 RepID=A0A7W9YE80_9ACTN|nr:2-phospho-L-lactate guanylyltransferase [Nocardiopsis mwathae]MBB6170459.1 2-phospho-L-lactate guanylyltransferase [Nocardiopsis mwathae]